MMISPRINNRNLMLDGLEMWFTNESPGGDKALAVGHLTMETVDRDQEGMVRNDLLLVNFSTGSAQVLMDDLWRCGIRPTAGHGSTGQMAAVERHLEDLRAILAEKLKSPLLFKGAK